MQWTADPVKPGTYTKTILKRECWENRCSDLLLLSAQSRCSGCASTLQPRLLSNFLNIWHSFFHFLQPAILFPLKDLCQGLTSTSTIFLSVHLSDYQSLLRKSLWPKMLYVCLQLYHMLQMRLLFCDGMTNRLMLRKCLKRNATEKEAAGKSPLQNDAPKAAFDHSKP